MDGSLWGNQGWFFLHIISFNYPENPTQEDKEYYRTFFVNLKNVLPCNECKIHYSKLIEEFPIEPHLDSKKELFKYVYILHKKVNKRLKKRNESFKNVLSCCVMSKIWHIKTSLTPAGDSP